MIVVWLGGYILSNLCSRFLANILCLLSFVMLFGCSYFFDEKVEETEYAYNEQKGECLADVNQTIKNFFNPDYEKNISEVDINNFVSCYQNTIESFLKHTISGGENPDHYSVENFERLVSRLYSGFYLPDYKIRYYLNLKEFLIGGGVDTLSADEIQAISRFIAKFGNSLKNINPYRRIILATRPLGRTKTDYELFRTAMKVLKNEVQNLFEELEVFKGKRFREFVPLVVSLLNSYDSDRLEQRKKYLPLILAFKNLALNTKSPHLSREDLPYFIDQSLAVYTAILEFDYFIENDSMFTNMGEVASFIARMPLFFNNAEVFQTVTLDAVKDVYEIAESILKGSLRRGRVIDFGKIESIIKGFEAGDMMTGHLTTPTLIQFIKEFSFFWLAPGQPQTFAITGYKISYTMDVFRSWFEKQSFLNSITIARGAKSLSLIESLPEFEKHPEYQYWKNVYGPSDATAYKSRFHQWDKQGRVLLSEKVDDFSYTELTLSNSIHVLMKLFAKPFNVNESDILNFKLNKKQAQRVYEVIRVLGVDLAFMDSRVRDSGSRGFEEANLFSTQLRNDAVLDFYEMHEYMYVLLASGNLADMIQRAVPQECLVEDIKGIHRKPVKKVDCFRSFLFDNFLTYFGHLERVKAFWQQADDYVKHHFWYSLEYASRAGVISDKHFDLAEIRIMASVLYYLETIYFNFDQDNNTYIQADEVKRAERHFRSLSVEAIDNFMTEVNKKGLLSIGNFKTGIQLDKGDLNRWAARVFLHLVRGGKVPDSLAAMLYDVIDMDSFTAIVSSSALNYQFDHVKSRMHHVLSIFGVLTMLELKFHELKVRSFIKNKWKELRASLVSSSLPVCLGKGNSHVFCDWSREIFCNENMNEKLYSDMREFSEKIFPEGPRTEIKDEEIYNFLYIYFTNSKSYRYLCAFPRKDMDRPLGPTQPEDLKKEESDSDPSTLRLLWESIFGKPYDLDEKEEKLKSDEESGSFDFNFDWKAILIF